MFNDPTCIFSVTEFVCDMIELISKADSVIGFVATAKSRESVSRLLLPARTQNADRTISSITTIGQLDGVRHILLYSGTSKS